MSKRQAHEQALQKRSDSGNAAAIERFIEKRKDQLVKLIGDTMTSERLLMDFMFAVKQSPELAQCELASIAKALITASKLQLRVGSELGEAYLIPRRIKGTMTCQFQLGYKGKVRMVMNSGFYTSIASQTVYPADEFEFELGSAPILRHRPSVDPGRKDAHPVAHYAVAYPVQGPPMIVVMSDHDVVQHRDRFSPAWNKGMSPWKDDHDAMAQKTCIHQLCKLLPHDIKVAGTTLKEMVAREDNATYERMGTAGAMTADAEVEMPNLDGFDDIDEGREPGQEG